MVLLGKRIKELRNKAKMTQTELAEKVGVTKSTIAAYENDSRSPSYEVLIKMANVFKVSTDSILLDRPGYILEIQGLNVQQLEILNLLIAYFRKSNYVEDFFVEFAPEVREQMREFIDPRIEDENKK